MADAFEVTLGGILLVAGLVGFWTACLWIESLLGGWMDLADTFPDPTPRLPEAFNVRMVAGRVEQVVRLSADRQGLRISKAPLFRIQHAPLLIPWPAITDIQVRNDAFEDEYILTLNGAENPLRFFDSYGKTILGLWKRRQSGEALK